MASLRLAAGFINSTPLDWSNNQRQIQHALELAQKEGVDLLCLPELCITGYGCEDQFLSADLRKRALESLRQLLPFTQGLALSVGLPFEFEGALYNCAALCAAGKLVALVPKQNLANDGLHYEPRWFKAWPRGRREKL